MVFSLCFQTVKKHLKHKYTQIFVGSNNVHMNVDILNLIKCVLYANA